MTIKDQFPPRIALDFRKGSLADQSSNSFAETLTAGTAYWKNTKDGRAFLFDGANTQIAYGNNADFDYNEPQSFLVNFQTSTSGIMVFAGKSDAAAALTGWLFYISSGKPTFRIYKNNQTTGLRVECTSVLNDGLPHTLICTYDGSGTAAGVNYYVDGQAVTDTDSLDAGFSGSTLNTAIWTFGESSYGGLSYDGTCCQYAQFGTEFTAQQASQLYVDIQREAHLTRIPLKTTLPQSVVYPEFSKDSIWTKGTGWTIANGKASSDGSQGADSLLTQARATANLPYTIEFEVSHYSAGNVAARVGATSGVNRAANGVYKERIDGGANVSLGLVADLDFIGDIEYCRAYQGSPIDFYQTGQDWNVSTANVTSGFLENTGWTVDSGSWQVDDGAENKQLTCVSAGIASYPSQQAYGTFQTDFQLGVSTNTINWDFIDNGTNQYRLQMGNDIFKITEVGVGDVVTGTWTSDTSLHEAKVTRGADGTFTLYLDNVSTGTPAADTTITSSILQSFDADANDAVKKLILKPTID